MLAGGGAGAQFGHRHVGDGLEQAALVVDQEHDRVIGINNRTLAVEVGWSAHGVFLFSS